MSVLRSVLAAAILAATIQASPASAQFFFKPKDLRGQPIKGDEPGIMTPLPGATEVELRAGLVWNMRAALNIAALQCQFEPTLLTVPNYNAVLKDHTLELKKAYDVLGKYFTRINKTKAAGLKAFDSYGTIIYSSLTPVSGQYNFCQTMGSIGRQALFTPRGGFGDLAVERMQELRNSMISWGDQEFPHGRHFSGPVSLPRLDPACWDKKGYWNAKKCGPDVQWVQQY
jgi:hypothetical protein